MSLDPTLLVTIGIIFLTTFIGAALTSLARDRCLKDIDDFYVTLKKKDKKLIRGALHLESTGFELAYRTDHLDGGHTHLETSFVTYKDEYPNIQAIYRYVDQLDDSNRNRRNRSAARTFHPGPARRAWRSLRNFTNTANDALRDVTDLLLGRSRLMTAETLLAPGQTRLKGMTKDILGYVGTRYDPLLENFIGVRVVFEISEDNSWKEYIGVLKEYSAEFLELLDVYFVQVVDLALRMPEPPSKGEESPSDASRTSATTEDGTIWALFEGDLVSIMNGTSCPLLVQTITLDDQALPVQAIVPGRETLRCHLPARPKAASLKLRTCRQVDIVVPRTHAVVRHRAERYHPVDDFRMLLPPSLWPGTRAGKVSSGGDGIVGMNNAEAAFRRWLFLANYGRIEEADDCLANSAVIHETLVLQEGADPAAEQTELPKAE